MSAARDRLKTLHWNSSAVDPVTNPGGMDDDGHVLNFPLALKDVGDVGQEMVDDNDAVRAALIAQQAAIVADNDATETAIGVLATAANNSKIAAAASAQTATDRAADSAAASAAALRSVTANFPERLEATGVFFSEVLVGDPGTIANVTGAKIVNAAGYGYLYQAAGGATLAHKGVLTAAQELVFEIAVEIEQTIVGGGETPAARIRLQGLDKDYASTGTAATSPLVVTPMGVTIITRRFAYVLPTGGTIWPQPGTAVWLRPAVDINRKSDDSAAAAGSTARVRRMSIRDVTAVVAAEVAAAAAAAAAAGVTFSTQAEAEAGTAPATVMSPLQTSQAIAYQAIPIGGTLKVVAAPSARFLACDGASYLKTSYPALAALLGDKFAAWTTTATTPAAGFLVPAIYVEPGLILAGGTNGRIWSGTDGLTWTQRLGDQAGMGRWRGFVKASNRYIAYGETSASGPVLYESVNGTTGWATAAVPIGNIGGTSGSISAMAVNGAAIVVVGGGLGGSGGGIRYSLDNGATWTDYGSLGTAPHAAAEVVFGNGLFLAFNPNGQTLYYAATPNNWISVSIAATVQKIDFLNGFFFAFDSIGGVWRSTNAVTWTRDILPALIPTAAATSIGYFNNAYHFASLAVQGQAACWATADFLGWWRVSAPAALYNDVRKLWPFGNKVIGAQQNGTGAPIVLSSFVHNPATEFPAPRIYGELPTFIKAL